MIEVVEGVVEDNPAGLPKEQQDEARERMRKDPIMSIVMSLCPIVAAVVEHGTITEFTKLA